MNAPDPPARHAGRSIERRALAAARDEAFIASLEAGVPLAVALDFHQLDRELAPLLAERPEVRRAIARRAIVLQDQLSSDAKGKRDAALIELERVHGWRKPSAQTVEDKFDAALTEFRELNPEGHAQLYSILMREGETAAEKRKRKRAS